MMSRILLRRPGHPAARGQILLIFAVAAVALIGILALAFDGGRVLMEQRNLQNAADGAALAGAIDIGPGTSSNQSHIAKDTAVYAIEKDLGISFSNNYSTTQEHYLNASGGSNCGAVACNPPYSDACCSWNDTTGAYTLTLTTPYNYNGSENEAYIHVDLIHHLPLTIGGEIFPNLDVHVQATARNYALPYALYTLKYYDPADYYTNGSATLTANADIGTNGSLTVKGGGGMGFNCIALNSGGTGYGGDLYEYVTGTGSIVAGSVTKGCSLPSAHKTIGLQDLPPIHLPPDPYGATNCATAGTCVNVSAPSGTTALAPTIPADPSASPGPRYGSVSVGNGSTLVLMPGVYFFEGASSAGLLTKNSGAAVVTGDCYNYAAPSCWTTSSAGNPFACPSGFIGSGGATLTRADGGTIKFACNNPDFGVLLVFYPHGSDVTATCTNVNPAASTNYYCTTKASSYGADNQLSVWAGSTLYLTSSPRYHNISVYVDYANEQGTSLNYTASASLSAAGCSTSSCALHIGIGSQVIQVGGGGVISVNGAIVAPDDNLALGGGTSGSGYGQIIGYTLSTQGSSPLTESYNPLALAYSPVIVQ